MLEELFADFASIYAQEEEVNEHASCEWACKERIKDQLSHFHYKLIQSYLDFIIKNENCTKRDIYQFLKSQEPND